MPAPRCPSTVANSHSRIPISVKPSELAIAFYHDVDKVCASLIQAVGLKYTEAEPGLKDPLLRWLDFTRRYISPEPREIETSKRLPRLLPRQFERAYLEMMGKIRRGEDVNPYQGRGLERNDTSGVKRQNRTDLLFADWKIHHLHITDDPIRERSDWLLFAIFEPGLARLVDIRPHSEGGVFANHDLIHAVAERWPEFMNRYRVNFGEGVSSVSLERELSTEDTYALRKGGVTSFVEIAGSIYMPPGMGVTSASTSGQTSLDMMKIRDAADLLATMVDDPNGQFAQHAAKYSIDKPEFSLSLTPKGLAVFEKLSNSALLLPREGKKVEPSALTFLHDLLVPDWVLKPLADAIKRDAESHGL